MALTPYATSTEFKDWVKLKPSDTIDDNVILDILLAVTEWVDEYTDRHFWRDGTTGSEVARTFASNCGFDVAIDDLVPGSLTTLKTDSSGDGVFETTWSASDYQLLPVNRPSGEPYTSIEAVGGLTFPTRTRRQSRANRVEVTGIWGWPTVPRMVKRACLIQANRELKRNVSPEGVAGFGEFGAIRLSGRLDPDVERNLASRRRLPLLVA